MAKRSDSKSIECYVSTRPRDLSIVRDRLFGRLTDEKEGVEDVALAKLFIVHTLIDSPSLSMYYSSLLVLGMREFSVTCHWRS
jgi:hypothetical protein